MAQSLHQVLCFQVGPDCHHTFIDSVARVRFQVDGERSVSEFLVSENRGMERIIQGQWQAFACSVWKGSVTNTLHAESDSSSVQVW
jgi:hypothetical protein